ncbi:ribosomal protein L11 methyltransferase [Paenibacillus baekrokdamisoli]|uniref:Ribosomal protein L11 methyltransferase n=1 Tax=Paenibacillus baekrokdamisoli TaxID=1712516 RepID=A0A3G9ISU7_9BACL|nr:50S ribosomal protein L11 methyltransferase [Paenibacillus baekrokdamisoli]MBB3070307.1 ribosomal protein L11 methyltransferase [Paenibacillus baekrokdamisoli]BBH21312.1 ribosomal protein L11 methyltransferase [Paenibacillus baekrokdamisoli]
MKWTELTISTTEESIEMISNFLHEMGAGGVSIEESGTLNKERDTSLGQWYELPLNDIPEGKAVIKGYFTEDIDIESVVSDLRPRIDELGEFDIDTGDYAISHIIVDEEDWANAWKQYFKPIRVSDRLTIKPTWEDYTASEGEQIIELDPGMAFGTGTHPTTALCLRTLESVIRGGEEVIDVGTGSGILAIGAMRLGAKSVLALDLDPIAVTAAGENSRLNGLEGDIQVQLSDLLGVLQSNSSEGSSSQAINITVPVDLVVANILAEIILLFVDDVYAAVKPGGIYIASGIYKNKEEDVAVGLEASGFVIIDRQRDQDWIAFVAKKPE